MPYRILVTKELSELFAALSHPMRIRIVEELHDGEKDVGTLVEILKISHSGVSQHLAVLRSHRIIVERKQGRNVFYHLRNESIAAWVLNGVSYVGPHQSDPDEFRTAVLQAKATWLNDEKIDAKSHQEKK